MRRGDRSWLTIAIVVALVLGGIASVWSSIAFHDRANLIDATRHRAFLFGVSTAADVSNQKVAASAGTGMTLFVLTSVLLSCWLYRLVRTSQQARPGLVGYSCGWAAGSWFIPVVNMVWPIRVIVDVWRKSGTGPEPDPLPRMITAWWTVLVAAELVVASAIAFGAGDSDAQVERHDHLASIGGILFAIAALLGVVAVRAVAERVRTLARAATAAQDAVRFNPPPGWPQPPRGWRPVPGWQPDPAWPPAPPSWTFWIPSAD